MKKHIRTCRLSKSMRIVAIIMSLLCLIQISYADSDFSSMSNEELEALIQSATEELNNRTFINDTDAFVANRVLFDIQGVKMYLTGKCTVEQYYDGSKRLCIEVIVENNSNYDISSGWPSRSFTINDWVTSWDSAGGVPAHSKLRDDLTFGMDEAGISSFSEVNTVSFGLRIRSVNNGEYGKELDFTTDTITIRFK